MKRIITIVLMLLPLLATGQNTKLSEAQSRKRVAQLGKLAQKYDMRYSNFCFHADLGIAVFTDTNYRQGIVDLNGNVLLPCEYYIFRQYINQKASNLFLVLNDNKLGLLDKNMRWVISMEYDHDIDCIECLDMSSWFCNGYACLQKNGKYGLVDTTGRVIIPFKFDHSFEVDMEHRMLRFGEYAKGVSREWITDFDSNIIIGPYESIGAFQEGLAAIRKDDHTGFVDTKGKVVIPCRYDYAWGFGNGLSYAEIDKRQMLIDKKGNVRYTFGANLDVDYSIWGNSVLIVLDKSAYMYGAVDATGRQLVPIRYSRWYTINDKYLAMVNDDGNHSSCDIYDKKGQLVAQFPQFRGEEYDDGYEYYSNYFSVAEDSLWGIVDSAFKTVIPLRYKEATYIGHNFVRVVTVDGQTQVIDMTGKVVINGPYGYVNPVSEDLFMFHCTNPDDYDDIIYGFVDIYGNTTASKGQLAQMKAWQKHK